ncbi:sulfatase-like hydrolase/transferase [Psychrosphaera algicola]|uniref:sulfatase-like hydrolase/transferase n=1 Tax=Psychrosphaera algicola TaxID=3023714 RepID=UPI002FEDE882
MTYMRLAGLVATVALTLTACEAVNKTELLSSQQAQNQGGKQPNVVFIFADDLGYGDLSSYGATKLETPNIDKLAKQGVKFTDAHSASAVCTASRYGLMTGEYPLRANNGKGIWGPAPIESPLLIDPDTTTIADIFKNKGYDTAVLGKWHLGFGEGKNDWQQPLRLVHSNSVLIIILAFPLSTAHRLMFMLKMIRLLDGIPKIR